MGYDSYRWRQGLERLKWPAVRDRLMASNARQGSDVAVTGVVEEAPHPSRAFVEAWYRDELGRTRQTKAARLQILAGALVVGTALAVVLALALQG